MPEHTNLDGTAGDGAENHRTDSGIRIRIWPAVLISLAHLAVAYGFARLASTNIQSAVALGGVPLASTVLLLVWWLAASRAPVRDRFAGLALFLAAATATVFAQKSPGIGALLLALVMPIMTLGMVAVLVVTWRLRWPARRWILAAYIIVCTAAFAALRVDTIGGNLAPIVSWRWNPTGQEKSEALPASDPQGTAVLPAQAGPGDWPGFRGATRDGRVTGVRFSTDWSTPPREVWRRKVGPAWSSFIAVGDCLFTQEQRGPEELVTCYRADTGEPVWVNRIEARFEDAMGLGPRATPAFHEGRLYTQGCTGVLQCLDASTGKTVWKRDLTKDAETKVPGYGFSSSPLIAGDRVIAFTGGHEGKSVVAYDRASGELAWRAGHGSSAYTSPHFALLGEVPQVLMASDWGLQSFLPETGESLWEYSWKVKTNPRCVQPLVVDTERVMLGATGTTGSRLLRIRKQENAWDINEEWASKKFRPYFNDGVSHKGYGYGFDGDRLACLDLKTGERRWDGKRYGGQLLFFAEMDTLLVLTEAGEVVLVPAIPERFTELARFTALTGKTWNHPVAAYGKLFVRNAEEAACFELPAPANPS